MSTRITAGNETANPTFTGDSDGSFAIRVGLAGSEQDAVQVSATGDVTLTSGKLKHGAVSFQKMQLFAIQNPTSGTFIDFTGIPSWAKKITMNLGSLSTNGTSIIYVQLGNSASIVTTGYLSASTTFGLTSNTGSVRTSGLIFDCGQGDVASAQRHGTVFITRMNDNTWALSGSVHTSTAYGCLSSAHISITNLDRVRIGTSNGTDIFTGGSVSVLVEGYE